MGRVGRAWLSLLAVVVLLAALAAGGVWYVGTTDFLQRVVDRAVAATGGRLSVEAVSGSLSRSVRAGSLQWRDGDTTVRITDAALDFSLASLLRGALHVESVTAGRIDVATGPDTGAAPTLPASLHLPLRLSIAEARIDELALQRAGADQPLRLQGIRFGLRYDGERYHVDRLVLDSAEGGLAASLSFADAPPYDIEAVARVAATIAGEQTATDLRAFGTPSALQVDAQGALHGASVSASVQLAPMSAQPIGAFSIDLAGLDLARLRDGLPQTRIEGRIEGEPVAAAAAAPPAGTPSGGGAGSGALPPIAGSFRLHNALPGPIDGERLPVDGASGGFRLAGDRLTIDELLVSGPPGTLHGTGSYRIDDRGFDLQLATEALDLRRVHTKLLATQLRGRLAIGPKNGALAFDAQLAERDVALEARATLAGDLLSFADATLKARDGVARFRGDVQVAAPFRFSLAGSVADFDPARFAEVPAGNLNGAWQASGQVQPALTVTAGITLVDSRWRGLPLAGNAQGIVEMGSEGGALPQRVRDLRLLARFGANTINASGALGAVGDRMAVVVDAQRLRELDERLAGRARIDGELRNLIARPAFVGKLRGEKLRFEDRLQLRTLQARGSLPDRDDGPFELSARGTGIAVDGRSIDEGTIDAQGTIDQHALTLRVVSKESGIDATARASGALVPGTAWRWQGRLQEARQAGTPALALTAPADLSVGPDRVSLQRATVQVDGPQGGTLVLEQASWVAGRIELQGSATRLPLRWLVQALPLEGLRTDDADTLRLGARWNLAGTLGPGGPLVGQLAMFRESGDIRIDLPALEGTTETIAAGIRRAELLVDVDGSRLQASLDLQGDALGSVQARAQTTLAWLPDGRRPDLSVPLQGSVELNVPSLAWTRSLVSEAWRFDGSLQAKLALSGTLAAPKASGQVTGKRLVAEQREIGMRLTNGELAAELRDNLLDIRTLRFESGDGSVEMRGALRTGGGEGSDAIVVLDRMPIPIGAGQRLVLSGGANASLRGSTLSIRGKLRANEGVIELSGNDAPRLAKDITIVRRAGEPPIRGGEGRAGVTTSAAEAKPPGAGAAPAASGRPAGARRGAGRTAKAAAVDPKDDEGFKLIANVEIDLGEQFTVFGSGVEARLAGTVTLSGEFPGNPRLHGTVRVVEGTYTGFGQKLEIERGTLVFTGPVDNPAIDIVAYRRYLPVEAGVALTGTAQAPRLQLVSRPDVPEADKLSWLVLGVGAESARSGGESAALQAAAATVLAASGSPTAGSGFASRFGLDVLSIRSGQAGAAAHGDSSASPQDSIVTLGKRLSDRLYVSYEQSLRGLQNLVRLQYEITDRLSVRLKTGTDSSIDLLWTYRYD